MDVFFVIKFLQPLLSSPSSPLYLYKSSPQHPVLKISEMYVLLGSGFVQTLTSSSTSSQPWNLKSGIFQSVPLLFWYAVWPSAYTNGTIPHKTNTDIFTAMRTSNLCVLLHWTQWVYHFAYIKTNMRADFPLKNLTVPNECEMQVWKVPWVVRFSLTNIKRTCFVLTNRYLFVRRLAYRWQVVTWIRLGSGANVGGL
jgi:hypothetical protein